MTIQIFNAPVLNPAMVRITAAINNALERGCLHQGVILNKPKGKNMRRAIDALTSAGWRIEKKSFPAAPGNGYDRGPTEAREEYILFPG